MDTAPTSIDPRYYNLTSREAAQLSARILASDSRRKT